VGDGLDDDPHNILQKGDPRPFLDPISPAKASGNNELTLGGNDAGFGLHWTPAFPLILPPAVM
jgi:hypothetical protein